VWRRQIDTWDLPAPPEDYALPPDLPWTEELRQFALSEYRAKFGRFLEPEEHYEMDWPPQGFLAAPGLWHVERTYCSDHGEEHDDSCDECRGLDHRGTVVIDQPAQWEWTVEVRKWAGETELDGSTSDIEVDAHQWIVGFTSFDPRDVEYGPEMGSPYRAEVIREFWASERADARALPGTD
jgi:hypothetical protein